MRYLLNFVVPLMFWCTACGAEDDPNPSTTLLDLNSLKAVDLSPGVRNTSIKLLDGRDWKFQISVPPHSDGRKLPLILALHWAGNSETYMEFMQCLVIPGFEDLPAIIVGPTDDNELWWAPPMNDKLLEFVRLSKSYWPIDPDKVVVTGYSNGGTGSWYFAANHPEAFSVAIPMAGFYQTYLKKIELPMYIIHGAQDELFRWFTAKPKVDYALGLGSDITVDLAEGRSHYEACLYVPNLKDAADWLTNSFWED